MSAIAGGVYFLSALVAILTAVTGKQLSLNQTAKGTEIKDSEGKIIATIPKTQMEPFTFSQIFLKRVSNITAQKQADLNTPDVKFKVLDADVKLSQIALIPDANFTLHGIIAIMLNDVWILPPTTAADFTDIGTFSLPLPPEGVMMRRNHDLRIWLWTDNGTASALTISANVSREVQIGQH